MLTVKCIFLPISCSQGGVGELENRTIQQNPRNVRVWKLYSMLFVVAISPCLLSSAVFSCRKVFFWTQLEQEGICELSYRPGESFWLNLPSDSQGPFVDWTYNAQKDLIPYSIHINKATSKCEPLVICIQWSQCVGERLSSLPLSSLEQLCTNVNPGSNIISSSPLISI